MPDRRPIAILAAALAQLAAAVAPASALQVDGQSSLIDMTAVADPAMAPIPLALRTGDRSFARAAGEMREDGSREPPAITRRFIAPTFGWEAG